MLKLLCDLQLVVVVMQSSEEFKVASVQSCRRLAAKSPLSPPLHSGLQWAKKCQLSFTTFHSSQPLFIYASSSSTHFPSNFRIQLCWIASESIRNLPKFRKEDLLPSIIQSISWHIQSQKSSEKSLEVRTRINKIVCIFFISILHFLSCLKNSRFWQENSLKPTPALLQQLKMKTRRIRGRFNSNSGSCLVSPTNSPAFNRDKVNQPSCPTKFIVY